jgi:MFS family permease
MVTPFLGVFLSNTIHMNIETIGTLLALATFIQFGGGIIGGVIAHKFGLKQTMVFALVFRTAGFLLLAAATIIHQVIILAIFLVAAGSALYMPANKAYLVSGVIGMDKPLFISIANASFNAGMALGPLVAALFIGKEPVWMFLSIALTFFVLTFFHQLKLMPIISPVIKPYPDTVRTSFVKILLPLWRPILFNLLIFYLYFYFQNFMGLYVLLVSGVHIFGWVMFLNFVMMIVLQLQGARLIAKINYRCILTVGFFLMGIGMVLMSQEYTLAIMLGTAIMTVGEAILFLRGDVEIVAGLPDHPSIAFGIQRLCMGIGGLLSGFLGGDIFQYCKTIGVLGDFWIIIAIQCFFAMVLGFSFALKSAKKFLQIKT